MTYYKYKKNQRITLGKVHTFSHKFFAPLDGSCNLGGQLLNVWKEISKSSGYYALVQQDNLSLNTWELISTIFI